MEVVRIFVEIYFPSSPIGKEPSRRLISIDDLIDCSDPHSVETLKRFDQCIEYFANGKFTDKDVDEAKLATFQKV